MRSELYEQHLNKQGVVWKYVESIPLDNINTNKGLKNQARLDEPLDQDLVDLYAAEKKDGTIFPAPVLHKPPRGQYVPIDGNHRLAADVKNKARATDAYVVETDDPMIVDRLTWSWNLINGKNLSYDERMQHACSFVRKYGMMQREAAREWGVNAATLGNHLSAEEYRDILNRHDVKVTPSLNHGKLVRLNTLKALGEDIAVAAAKTVMETGIGEPAIEELVRAVKRAKDHESKMNAIAEFANSDKAIVAKAATKGGRVRAVVRPSTRLSNALRTLEKLYDDFPQDASLRPLQPDFRDVQGCAKIVVERTIRLFGLGALPKENVG